MSVKWERDSDAPKGTLTFDERPRNFVVSSHSMTFIKLISECRR